jgi:hypothetical protein
MSTEAIRQQRLLAALWSRTEDGLDPAGVAAYRANAGAAAERALAAAFPTVQQLVGDEAFAAIARQLWRQHPPRRGDLAQWGDALPAWLATDPALADEPYLPDVARVDLAVHRAEMAADAAFDPAVLARLADVDAAALRLRLVPGVALVRSPHPVATVWSAHRSTDADRFAPVRAAFAAGQGEAAFVWRHGWRGDVVAVAHDHAAFLAALIEGATLAEALDRAPDLDFETWLLQALRLRWLADLETA